MSFRFLVALDVSEQTVRRERHYRKQQHGGIELGHADGGQRDEQSVNGQCDGRFAEHEHSRLADFYTVCAVERDQHRRSEKRRRRYKAHDREYPERYVERAASALALAHNDKGRYEKEKRYGAHHRAVDPEI